MRPFGADRGEDGAAGDAIVGMGVCSFDGEEAQSGVMADVDQALGIRWATWWRWAACTWLALFASAWVSVLWAWSGETTNSTWLSGIALCAVVVVNGTPGVAALSHSEVRQRLLGLPEAAALGLLTLSAVVGIGGSAGLGVMRGEEVGLVAAGIVIGIVAFPLTLGMIFPLGIPLVCGLVVWSWIRARGGMSRTGYALASGIAAVGWVCVRWVGTLLGAV